jgi:NitT/TauT family transport system permease protein
MNGLARSIALLALALILWQIVADMRIWPAYVFPTPSGVLKAVAAGMEDGDFLAGSSASLKRMALGFGIALFIGTALGIAMAKSRAFAEIAGPLVLGLQTLPSICWLPLAVLWFGLSDRAIVFVVVIGATWSVALAICSGITNVPPIFINAARTMGARGLALYYEVIFPAALPTIIGGVRQGWSFAWRSLMAGELVFFTAGLGQLLQVGRELNDINQIVAVMLLIMGIGYVIERLVFKRLENGVKKKWGLER